MNRILELRQNRTAALTKAGEILDKATAEKRGLTSEETVQYDAYFGEAESLRETAEREERQAGAMSAMKATRFETKKTTGVDEEESRAAMVQWIRGGFHEVDEPRRPLLLRANQRAHDFGRSDALAVAPERRAAQSEITGALGGYVVPTGFYAQVQAALKYYAGMMEAGCSEINTAAGNDLPIPTSDDTANMGQILGESSPETTQEIPFGQVIMKAFKYSTRLILIPIELLQDSGVDIEAYIIDKMGVRLGRVANLHFTTGDGNGKPRGVAIDTPAGVTAGSGHTSDITYNNLIDTKYSVNRSYRMRAKWMMNDATLKAILKLVDSNGRPLILDYLNTLRAGEPDTLLGQPIVYNNDMADLGASNKPIIYGDFSNYWIRRVMALMMMRLTERYAEAGQVGFLGFMRMDGRMVDAGQHPLKAFVNSAS